MNPDEKNTLYNFLRLSVDYMQGYRSSDAFPNFEEMNEQVDSATSQDVFTKQDNTTYFDREMTHCYTLYGEGPEELSRLSNSVEVMVIGDSFIENGIKVDASFSGNEWQLLDKMLEAIHLSRKTNSYIINVVRLSPSDHEPTREDVARLISLIQEKIRIQRPRAILSVGEGISQILLNCTQDISSLRGQFFSFGTILLMPIFHPSVLLRDESLKRPAWEDLKKFRLKLDQLSYID